MRVVLAQRSPVSRDIRANAKTIEAVLAESESDLVVFPELWLCGYELSDVRELALPVQHPAITGVRQAAAKHSTAVVFGFAELLDDDGVANSAVLVDEDGRLAGVYRKSHLFGDAERAAFQPGSQLVVTTLAHRRVGVLICFDVEFPEPARALCQAGADLLVTISANMAPHRVEHELAAAARALENRAEHIYVNRVGSAGVNEFVGCSRVINRDGVTIASAGTAEETLAVDMGEPGALAPELDYRKQINAGLAVEELAPGQEWGEET